MSGPRNPRNILLEYDCTLHECDDDGHTNGNHQQPYILPQNGHHHQPYTPPQNGHHQQPCIPPQNGYQQQPYIPSQHGPQNGRCCKDGYGTPDTASDLLYRNSRRTCATPDEFSARKSLNDRCGRPTEYGEQFAQKSPASDNHTIAKTVRPTEYGEQFRQTVTDIHIKGSRPADYHEQFRQGIVDNIHTNRRGLADVDAHLRQVSEDALSKSNETRCSREKPQGTPFACNDCREPQCLYCWRKCRDVGGDFTFLDGFETQEQAWKPGKKIVEQFSDCYIEPNLNASRRSTLLEDQLHPQNHKWKQSTCQPSYSQEEPKWKPTNNFHDCHGDHETKEHCNKRQDPSFKENEWKWPLGKGRGRPIAAEWLPPFRNNSTLAEHPLPPYQRIKGVGEIPNLDDWVPPFRGEQEQHYNWHRCKGSGDCPPQDQWLAPWSDSSEKERVDRVYGGRHDGPYSKYPEGDKFWRGETREVF